MISQDTAPKIGIVIPIYNVAPYLVECLESVVNQSYGDFCAVLVNDVSTDESLKIALDFVARDARFVLIDKENGGLSSARNVGIRYFNDSGNLSWGMRFCTCENFEESAESASFGGLEFGGEEGFYFWQKPKVAKAFTHLVRDSGILYLVGEILRFSRVRFCDS